MRTPMNAANNAVGTTRWPATPVFTLAGPLLLVPALLVACGGDDTGLTRAEVEEIAREEVADLPDETRSAGSNDAPAMPVTNPTRSFLLNTAGGPAAVVAREILNVER